MKAVLIAGGTGLIGQELSKFLGACGYTIKILSRKATNKEANIFQWNIASGFIDPEALTGVTAIINLAGSPIIGPRWTNQRKAELRNSRILSTRLLVETLKSTNNQVQSFIQASAMGYFGDSDDTILVDESPPGNDFVAELCKDWEAEVSNIPETINTSILRIGFYLSKAGGVYETIAKLAKFYLATSFGSGKQFLNYTHKDEFNQWVLKLIEQKIPAGTYNAVGKEPVRMNEFVRAIVKNEKRFIWSPNVPKFLLKIVLGEASIALLSSYRITSPKLMQLKLHRYENIHEALKDL